MLALVAEPDSSPMIQSRVAGFRLRASLAKVDVDVLSCGTKPGENSFAKAYETLRAALKAKPVAGTGIFVVSDTPALAALKALSDAGVNVPDAVGVIGYDGIPEGAYYHPALTTIKQDLAGWVEASLRLMRQRISDPAAPVAHVKVPPSLIVRKS